LPSSSCPQALLSVKEYQDLVSVIMMNRSVRILLVINLLVLVVILVRQSVDLPSIAAQSSAVSEPEDNQELLRMYREDQSDRTLPAGQSIDWSVVGARDRTRLARVKELYSQNLLQTGNDYFHAAMVLQHGDVPEDYLLAHELCVVAISRGNTRARWLAAASEDRYLMNIGRPQRFGTQYRSEGNGPLRLYRVDQGVTDGLRRALNVPSIAEARAREADLNKKN
jgi:hypothetical protein